MGEIGEGSGRRAPRPVTSGYIKEYINFLSEAYERGYFIPEESDKHIEFKDAVLFRYENTAVPKTLDEELRGLVRKITGKDPEEPKGEMKITLGKLMRYGEIYLWAGVLKLQEEMKEKLGTVEGELGKRPAGGAEAMISALQKSGFKGTLDLSYFEEHTEELEDIQSKYPRFYKAIVEKPVGSAAREFFTSEEGRTTLQEFIAREFREAEKEAAPAKKRGLFWPLVGTAAAVIAAALGIKHYLGKTPEPDRRPERPVAQRAAIEEERECVWGRSVNLPPFGRDLYIYRAKPREYDDFTGNPKKDENDITLICSDKLPGKDILSLEGDELLEAIDGFLRGLDKKHLYTVVSYNVPDAAVTEIERRAHSRKLSASINLRRGGKAKSHYIRDWDEWAFPVTMYEMGRPEDPEDMTSKSRLIFADWEYVVYASGLNIHFEPRPTEKEVKPPENG